MSLASASWRTICPQHKQKVWRPDLSGKIVSSIVQMPLLGFTSWIRVITKILQRFIFFVFFFGGEQVEKWVWLGDEVKGSSPKHVTSFLGRYILQQSLPFGKFRESSSRTETAPSSKSSPPVSYYVMVIYTEFLYYGGLLVVDLPSTLSVSGWSKISITASCSKPIVSFEVALLNFR